MSAHDCNSTRSEEFMYMKLRCLLRRNIAKPFGLKFDPGAKAATKASGWCEISEMGDTKKREGRGEKARWVVRKRGAKKRDRWCGNARWVVRKGEIEGAKKRDGCGSGA